MDFSLRQNWFIVSIFQRRKISAYIYFKSPLMKNLIRAIVAGIGAKKIGGGRCGCIGTVVVFIILYWLLGYVFKVF